MSAHTARPPSFRRRIIAVLFIVPLLAMAACTQSKNQGGGGDGRGDASPQSTGNLLYVIPSQEDREIDGLDPVQASGTGVHTMWGALYSTLFTQNPDTGELEPGLAESWKVSDDRLTWNIHLRDDVVFHNGDKMTSEDVLFTLDRARDDQYLPRSAIIKGFLTNVESWEAEGPYDVTIHLKVPQVTLGTSALGRTHLSIVPKNYFQKVGKEEFGKHPIGTGPFKFVSWKPGDSIKMERNPDFKWGPPYTETAGGPARLETLTFKYINDPNTRISAYLANEADVIEGVAFTDIPRLEGSGDTEVMLVEKNGSTSQFNLNVTNAPTDDVNVRRAISASIDRDAFTKVMFGSAGTPECHFIQKRMGDFLNKDACAPEFDLKKAASLLDDAGWTMGSDKYRHKDGKRLTLVGVVGSAEVKFLEFVQAQLKESGIEVKIKSMTDAGVLEQVNDRDSWNIHLASVEGRTNEDPNILQSMWASFAIPPKGAWNYSAFTTPELDKLLADGIAELDRDKRVAIYHKAQDILADQVPAVPYSSAKIVVAHRNTVHGLMSDIRGSYRYFFDVWEVE